jgi:hypothetical protein
MLTKAVPSQSYDEDKALLQQLDLKIRKPFKEQWGDAPQAETATAATV